MLDLSLGSWRIWDEKVWAAVYHVPSDTRVLEILSSENLKMLHGEFLYDESLNSHHSHICMLVRIGKTSTFIYCLCALSLVELCWPLELFMRLKSRSHTPCTPCYFYPGSTHHHIHPFRSTQKCSAPTLGVNTKIFPIDFPYLLPKFQNKCSKLLSSFLSKFHCIRDWAI